MRLAAGDPGGLYLAFAEILAKQLQDRYPNVAVEVLPTEGTRRKPGPPAVGGGRSGPGTGRRRRTGPRHRARANRAPSGGPGVRELSAGGCARLGAAVHRLADLEGLRVSIGPPGSGGAMTSEVLFEAAGLRESMDMLRYRLGDGLAALADGSLDALVWSGGVPTPAIAELAATTPLRMLDIGELAAPMGKLAGYPYVVRQVPTGDYVPPGMRSLGVPDLLLCRQRNVRRPGRRGRERTCHRGTAIGAALRPGAAVPRRTLDDPDRSRPTASGRGQRATGGCTAESCGRESVNRARNPSANGCRHSIWAVAAVTMVTSQKKGAQPCSSTSYHSMT